MTADDPELRSDARRNRERIVAAGRALFGDSADVPMYEVARRAGVGQATLYRHFPDRYALVDAISRLEFAGLAELAAQQAEQPDGVIVLLRDLTQRIAGLRGLAELMRTESPDGTRGSRREEVAALFRTPLAVAKAAGTVRADLAMDDVLRMIVMIESAVVDEPDPARRRLVADRAQELLVDGLRPAQPDVSDRLAGVDAPRARGTGSLPVDGR